MSLFDSVWENQIKCQRDCVNVAAPPRQKICLTLHEERQTRSRSPLISRDSIRRASRYARGRTMELRTVSADDWRAWRSERLAALTEAPGTFGSRLHERADAPGDRWRERLSTRVRSICWPSMPTGMLRSSIHSFARPHNVRPAGGL